MFNKRPVFLYIFTCIIGTYSLWGAQQRDRDFRPREEIKKIVTIFTEELFSPREEEASSHSTTIAHERANAKRGKIIKKLLHLFSLVPVTDRIYRSIASNNYGQMLASLSRPETTLYEALSRQDINTGDTVLHLAVKLDHIEAISGLFEASLSLTPEEREQIIVRQNFLKETALFRATKYFNILMIAVLLGGHKEGPKALTVRGGVSKRGYPCNTTPLLHIIKVGMNYAIKYIFRHGGTYAAESLIQAGGVTKSGLPMDYTPLHMAVKHARTYALDFLLQEGGERAIEALTMKDAYHETPLYKAVKLLYTDQVRSILQYSDKSILIKGGMDCVHETKLEETPVHLALRLGCVCPIKIMLSLARNATLEALFMPRKDGWRPVDDIVETTESSWIKKSIIPIHMILFLQSSLSEAERELIRERSEEAEGETN